MTAKTVYEYLPVFERHLFYTNDLEHFERTIHRYFRPEDVDVIELVVMGDDGCFGFAAQISKRRDPERVMAYVMFVKDKASLGTISHEATHICNKIFDYIGQMSDEINDEVQAYLVGHLVDRFMENIRGEKKSKRKLVKGRYKKNIE